MLSASLKWLQRQHLFATTASRTDIQWCAQACPERGPNMQLLRRASSDKSSSPPESPPPSHKKPTYEEQMKKLKSIPCYTKYRHSLLIMEKEDPQQFQDLLHKITEEPAVAMTDNRNNDDLEGLDAIMDVSKLRLLSCQQIADLWIRHYAKKEAICAVLPASTYAAIKSLLQKYPLFLYPLPKKSGYEMFFGYWQEEEIHFIALNDWKTLKNFSPKQLTIKHYCELAEEKDIVLMSGQVLDQNLSVRDAQVLGYLVQHFYISHPQLVEEFNRYPDNRDQQKIINKLDVSQLLKSKDY